MRLRRRLAESGHHPFGDFGLRAPQVFDDAAVVSPEGGLFSERVFQLPGDAFRPDSRPAVVESLPPRIDMSENEMRMPASPPSA